MIFQATVSQVLRKMNVLMEQEKKKIPQGTKSFRLHLVNMSFEKGRKWITEYYTILVLQHNSTCKAEDRECCTVCYTAFVFFCAFCFRL